MIFKKRCPDRALPTANTNPRRVDLSFFFLGPLGFIAGFAGLLTFRLWRYRLMMRRVIKAAKVQIIVDGIH